MPTIDDLPVAVSVSDGDELVISQSDIARKATRAQILSGVQPAIAIPAGSLLGRISPGLGGPEVIGVGANLSIASGVLVAQPPFIIDQLPTGGLPMATDEVPIGQGGQNAAVSYAAFISGLSSISDIDGSNLNVSATGGIGSRRLADYFDDALTVESFGAVGDGVTDDTLAFNNALASGQPLRLSGKTYVVNGTIVFSATRAVLGVPGISTLKRTLASSESTWIEVSQSLDVSGVIFDAAGLVGTDCPAVAVLPSCLQSAFFACQFLHAIGPNFGSGISISGVAGSTCEVSSSHFDANGLHGIVVSGAGSITIGGCSAQTNANCGIRVGAGVSCFIRNSQFVGNQIGLSVGDWNAGPAPTQPGVQCVLVGNVSSSNTEWGIAVAGVGGNVAGNTVSNNGVSMPGGGILARLGASQLVQNTVYGGGVGIDARGCWGSTVSRNHVSQAALGVAAGGSQNVTVSDNVLLTNIWGISVSAIEPALSATPTGPVTLARNWIGFTTAQGGGINVMDAAEGIAVVENDINGWGSATVNQALWLHTDAAVVVGNRWNNQGQYTVQANVVNGLNALVVPDLADAVSVTNAPTPVMSLLTNHQADTLGQITFIKVTGAGAGYTNAQVAVTGSGTGAAASAIVQNGNLIWIVVSNAGSGYGIIGNQATVTISGDGTGATAEAYVGLPVVTGRRLRLSCNTRVQLAQSGSSPPLQSWTEFASTIPAFGAVELEGAFGGWRAVAFPPIDYLTPTGDGGVVFQSAAGGSISLRPAAGGALHLASGIEVVGCTSSVGRGSPLNSIAAPPGSDFRNLTGGAGNTFWIKQTNNDATGWIAIA